MRPMWAPGPDLNDEQSMQDLGYHQRIRSHESRCLIAYGNWMKPPEVLKRQRSILEP